VTSAGEKACTWWLCSDPGLPTRPAEKHSVQLEASNEMCGLRATNLLQSLEAICIHVVTHEIRETSRIGSGTNPERRFSGNEPVNRVAGALEWVSHIPCAQDLCNLRRGGQLDI